MTGATGEAPLPREPGGRGGRFAPEMCLDDVKGHTLMGRNLLKSTSAAALGVAMALPAAAQNGFPDATGDCRALLVGYESQQGEGAVFALTEAEIAGLDPELAQCVTAAQGAQGAAGAAAGAAPVEDEAATAVEGEAAQGVEGEAAQGVEGEASEAVGGDAAAGVDANTAVEGEATQPAEGADAVTVESETEAAPSAEAEATTEAEAAPEAAPEATTDTATETEAMPEGGDAQSADTAETPAQPTEGNAEAAEGVTVEGTATDTAEGADGVDVDGTATETVDGADGVDVEGTSTETVGTEATEDPAAAGTDTATGDDATMEANELEDALAAEEAAQQPADAAAGTEADAAATTEGTADGTEAPAADTAATAEGATPDATTTEGTAAAGATAETAAPAPQGDLEVVQEDTEQAAEAANQQVTAAAATAPEGEQATGETETTVVTEENTRSSSEDFQAQAAASSGDGGNSRLSDFAKIAAGVAGGVVLNELLNRNDQVVENTGDRVVVQRQNGEYYVLKDDDTLIRQPGTELQTQRFDDGSSRTIASREDGSQVITIRAANGQVLRRVRVLPDGQQVVLFDDTATFEPVNVSELPQPQREFISIDDMQEDSLRQALASEEQAAVTGIDRRFSLSQVRNIRAVRNLVPIIEIDQVTFDTGSAAIRPTEAEELAAIGRTMRDMIAEDPYRVFLVEGHTDAVGSASMNLALSDRRAESLALALTEYFDVPPENMVVQGYGESNLKIPSGGDVRENRRVAVRDITTLLQTQTAQN